MKDDMREDYFWNKISKTGREDCWLWEGAVDKDGAGRHEWQGKKVRAHRLAYALAHGLDLSEIKYKVERICKTVLCCNPRHSEEIQPGYKRKSRAKTKQPWRPEGFGKSRRAGAVLHVEEIVVWPEQIEVTRNLLIAERDKAEIALSAEPETVGYTPAGDLFWTYETQLRNFNKRYPVPVIETIPEVSSEPAAKPKQARKRKDVLVYIDSDVPAARPEYLVKAGLAGQIQEIFHNENQEMIFEPEGYDGGLLLKRTPCSSTCPVSCENHQQLSIDPPLTAHEHSSLCSASLNDGSDCDFENDGSGLCTTSGTWASANSRELITEDGFIYRVPADFYLPDCNDSDLQEYVEMEIRENSNRTYPIFELLYRPLSTRERIDRYDRVAPVGHVRPAWAEKYIGPLLALELKYGGLDYVRPKNFYPEWFCNEFEEVVADLASQYWNFQKLEWEPERYSIRPYGQAA